MRLTTRLSAALPSWAARPGFRGSFGAPSHTLPGTQGRGASEPGPWPAEAWLRGGFASLQRLGHAAARHLSLLPHRSH